MHDDADVTKLRHLCDIAQTFTMMHFSALATADWPINRAAESTYRRYTELGHVNQERFMDYNTSELCNLFADNIDVVEPMFVSFGGRPSYGGKISTIKCHEDNGLVKQVLVGEGMGRVLLIDGGGSMRRALVDNDIAQQAVESGWEGIICYGSVRDVDALAEFDLGIHAIASIPVGAESEGIGEVDLAVNFGGVTFLPEDHIYADNTGIILSPDALDID